MKTIRASDICRHLRSKAMYVPASAEKIPGEWTSDSAPQPHCWCNITMTEIGEDSLPTSLTTCIQGRNCYKPK
jgi:hypothetical protein